MSFVYWQTVFRKRPLQTGFAAVTKYISVITKSNSQDTTLAYGTFWEIYTVYIHTVLTLTHTQHNPSTSERELPFLMKRPATNLGLTVANLSLLKS